MIYNDMQRNVTRLASRCFDLIVGGDITRTRTYFYHDICGLISLDDHGTREFVI